jgi:phage gp46-like protein
MAQNLQIDPVAKDYVVVNGSPIESDRVEEKAYIALQIPQGEYLYGVTGQGSFLYTLANQKRDASVEQEFNALASDAIQKQLVNTGDATAQQVSNIAASRTGSSNQISIVPAQTSLSNQLNFTSV